MYKQLKITEEKTISIRYDARDRAKTHERIFQSNVKKLGCKSKLEEIRTTTSALK